ncbi:HD domain-containing protein [Candidatus Micrarchaeota archaeon]|nr:HD domain-containing protein [Candidatus Micrarchaeota archaeon]
MSSPEPKTPQTKLIEPKSNDADPNKSNPDVLPEEKQHISAIIYSMANELAGKEVSNVELLNQILTKLDGDSPEEWDEFLNGPDNNMLRDVHGFVKMSPVEEEVLFRCPAYTRLREIRQSETDMTGFWLYKTTRHQHSIGVMELAGRFTEHLGYGERDIQKVRFAGLFHDISHFVFSHSTEKLIEKSKGIDHEDLIEDRIINSEIHDVLKKHGFDEKEIKEIVSIAKGEGPLGKIVNDWADRFDYLIRDSYFYGFHELHGRIKRVAYELLDNVRLIDGEVCIPENNKRLLDEYTNLRTELFVKFYFHPFAMATRDLLLLALKEGLDKGIIDLDELITGKDDFIINKLVASGSQTAEDLSHGLNIRFSNVSILRLSEFSETDMKDIETGKIKEEIIQSCGLEESELLIGTTPSITKKVHFNLVDSEEKIKPYVVDISNRYSQRFFYIFLKDDCENKRSQVNEWLKKKYGLQKLSNQVNIVDYEKMFDPKIETNLPHHTYNDFHHSKGPIKGCNSYHSDLDLMVKRLSLWPSDFENEILNSDVMKRMDDISQFYGERSGVFLFLSSTRLAHSVGTMLMTEKIARKLLTEALNKDYIKDTKEMEYIIKHLRMAALFHDRGHVPYSHAGEIAVKLLTSKNHEEIGEELIRKDFGEVLEKEGYDIELILSFIRGEGCGSVITEWADRLDYLWRDSRTSDVKLSQYHQLADLMIDLIPECLTLSKDGTVLFKQEKLNYFEDFHTLRRGMYRYVYLHPGMQATQKIISSMLIKGVEQGFITFDDLFYESDEYTLKDKIPDDWPEKCILIHSHGLIETYNVKHTYLIGELSEENIEKIKSGEMEKLIRKELGVDEEDLSLVIGVPDQPRTIKFNVLKANSAVEHFERVEDTPYKERFFYVYFKFGKYDENKVLDVIKKLMPEYENALVDFTRLDLTNDF